MIDLRFFVLIVFLLDFVVLIMLFVLLMYFVGGSRGCEGYICNDGNDMF